MEKIIKMQHQTISFFLCKSSNIKPASIHIHTHTYRYTHTHTHIGCTFVKAEKNSSESLQQASMTVHLSDYLSTVAPKAVLASAIYPCATWDYILSESLKYLG